MRPSKKPIPARLTSSVALRCKLRLDETAVADVEQLGDLAQPPVRSNAQVPRAPLEHRGKTLRVVDVVVNVDDLIGDLGRALHASQRSR